MNLGLRRDLSVVRVVSCSTSTSDPKSQNSISPASGEYLRKNDFSSGLNFESGWYSNSTNTYYLMKKLIQLYNTIIYKSCAL